MFSCTLKCPCHFGCFDYDTLQPDYDFRFVRCQIYRPHVQERMLAGRYSLAAHSLHMLGILIVLYGLEGLYFHVPVRMVQKG